MVNTLHPFESLTRFEYEMATGSQGTCNGGVISVENGLLHRIQAKY